MAAINNWTLNDFSEAIKSQMQKSGVKLSAFEQADKSIREYYSHLAVNDDGEDSKVYEATAKEFNDAVANCINNILTQIKSEINEIIRSYTNGAKENGAQLYDVVDEYTNGQLTKSKYGYDDNNDGQITDQELEYEFVAGIPRPNGAQNEDTMYVYNNGQLSEIVTGYDENEDGYLDGNEITYLEKVDNNERQFGL